MYKWRVTRFFHKRWVRHTRRIRRMERKRAAIFLQATFRGAQQRRTKAAAHVQSMFRMKIAIKIVQLKREQRDAARRIQRLVRWQQHRQWMAAKIQATMRMKRQRQFFVRIRRASIEIESVGRGFLTRRRIRKLHACALIVQCTFRAA